MDRAERWKERVENSPHGLWWMGAASYLESTVVPIPLETVLVPYMVARRDRLWAIATVVTLACLLGALTGYAVGFFLFESVGDRLIEWMGWSDAMGRFRELFADHGFWAVVAVGVVPIPFQVAMLAAGAARYPVLLFVLAATIARGIRYYGLALLVMAAGDRAQRLWDDHATAVALTAAGLFGILLLVSLL